MGLIEFKTLETGKDKYMMKMDTYLPECYDAEEPTAVCLEDGWKYAIAPNTLVVQIPRQRTFEMLSHDPVKHADAPIQVTVSQLCRMMGTSLDEICLVQEAIDAGEITEEECREAGKNAKAAG